MSRQRHRAAIINRANAARFGLAITGATAMAWAFAVFPMFSSENVIVDVARAVITGEVFKPDVLAAVEARTEIDGRARLRSSVLGKAVVIRLRRAEDAIRAGNIEVTDQRFDSLARSVDEALQNAPDDPLIWLVRFWLDSTRNGLRSDNLSFLRTSYELGPYEGWIALKRDRIALAAFAALPNDLAERAISEFVELVKWGLVPEAAEIAAGPGLPLRGILFPRLRGLSYDQRRVFADAIYGRELDDVPVPGIAPPAPQIPMPILPPDF
jgi:hypothetical protein